MRQWMTDPGFQIVAALSSVLLFLLGIVWIGGAFTADRDCWWTVPFWPFALHASALWLAVHATPALRWVVVPLAGLGCVVTGGIFVFTILDALGL
jgi:hypothetical protein